MVRSLLVVLSLASLAWAAPAEGPKLRRFDDEAFLEGLQQRGLIELLEYHLEKSPPADPLEARLLQRQVRLAQYADTARPDAERRAALESADTILADVIREHADDPRVFQWRLEWLRSILYRRAEPYYTNLLYWGGSQEDRDELFRLMQQASEAIATLMADLEEEYTRLDNLPVRQYDRLETTGYIETVEQIGPQAEYMRQWVTFYRALARPDTDPQRSAELKGLLETLRQPPGYLDSPHDSSHVQAQLLLAAGMASRLIGAYTESVGYLDRAVSAVRGVRDAEERDSLRWVATLGMLERARALRDDRQFDRAIEAVRRFRDHAAETAAGDFGLELLAALLERSIYIAQAERVESAGDRSGARLLREQSVEALSRLADRGSECRDQVYAALCDRLDRSADVDSLPAFEQCALLAGLLRQAGSAGAELDALPESGGPAGDADRKRLSERRSSFLAGAVDLANRLLNDTKPGFLSQGLHAEVLYNLGVAHFESGDRQSAARRFLDVARDFPRFSRAESAARSAVQLAAELYGDPVLRSTPGTTTLYVQALQTLTDNFAQTESARYWRFFLAQTLEELGELDQAVAQYDRVDEAHEHYYQAAYSAVRCRANALKSLASTAPAAQDELRRRAAAVADAASRLEKAVSRAEESTGDPVKLAAVRRLLASALVNLGEVLVLPGVDRAEDAVAAMDGFEERFPGEAELIGRVLRTRVIALESLGRLDEAAVAIPRYVQSDPANAGPVLQGLFDSIREDIERLDRGGQKEAADAKAASALLLARQIREWASHRSPPLFPPDLYAVDLQLAQSHLRAGQWHAARQLFSACLDMDAARYEDRRPRDPAALVGMAESLYGLEQFESALPLFNRVVRESADHDSLWWNALLRDLQCRTRLDHEPGGIVKVIQQHKFLDPQMGGEALREQFDRLEQVNRQRGGSG